MIPTNERARILRKYPKVKIKFLDDVYDEVVRLVGAKKEVTTTLITRGLKCKRNSVVNAVKKLRESRSIKTQGSSIPIPYLKMSDNAGKAIFVWGQPKRHAQFTQAMSDIQQQISHAQYQRLSVLVKQDEGAFMNYYSALVRSLWQSGQGANLRVMTLGTKALRYTI